LFDFTILGLYCYRLDNHIAGNLWKTAECLECVDWIDVISVIVDITQHPCERSLFSVDREARVVKFLKHCKIS